MAVPMPLYSVQQVRAFDAGAIAAQGVDAYELMCRAGRAALRRLRRRWPQARRLAIATGGGNNGGDGYVVARLARQAGLEACVLALVEPSRLGGAAARAAADWTAAGGTTQPFDAAALTWGELVIDALLGTGLRSPLDASMLAAIRAINDCRLPVYALDVPSGLDADRGVPLEDAVRATATITFVAPKVGLCLHRGPEFTGELDCDDLGVQRPRQGGVEPALLTLGNDVVRSVFRPRQRSAHKGDFGRVLVVAGGEGMGGAARLAGEACLRAGAGLVTVATRAGNTAALLAGRPELICHAVADGGGVAVLAAQATVLAAGPGLGTDDWARSVLAAVLAAGRPLVLDADALNLLAQGEARVPPGSILTPHPGEAARLLGTDARAVQADRLAALHALVELAGCVVVLKGAGTLVGAPGRTNAICLLGNPAMAAPGMGDVLCGAIAAARAQCADPFDAACAGVVAHAAAGDALAAERGARAMLALDVAARL